MSATAIVIGSVREMKRAGEVLAGEILNTVFESTDALVIGLEGELGAGKTVFVQGLAKGLGIREKIVSPTFVIFKKYRIRKRGPFDFLCHFDCYRAESGQDLLALGLRELLADSRNLVVLEWAEKAKKALPAKRYWIKFKHLTEDRREIVL